MGLSTDLLYRRDKMLNVVNFDGNSVCHRFQTLLDDSTRGALALLAEMEDGVE